MNLKNQSVMAVLLCDLTQHLEGRQLQCISIGAKRDVLMISFGIKSGTTPLHRKTLSYDFSPYSLKLHHWHDGTIGEIDLPSTHQDFSAVQATGNDGYLCVDAHSFDGAENVHLFDDNGKLLISWHAGDDIDDVQVAPNGDIWVSYIGSGDSGNWPLSQQGIVCFDSQGNPNFEFNNDIAKKVEETTSCSGFNVDSNCDTWLSTSTSSYLIHLHNRGVQALYQAPPEMSHSHAFAVCGSQWLFTGAAYLKNRIFWHDEVDKRLIELEVTDENGDTLIWDRSYRACGRGADLFLCNGPIIWMLSLNEMGF